uniref:Mucin-like domain-containing protein n=1 Tax=Glossina brevipalpis TaxID=37001 RepID=A0A1A9WZJ9_9MUSC
MTPSLCFTLSCLLLAAALLASTVEVQAKRIYSSGGSRRSSSSSYSNVRRTSYNKPNSGSSSYSHSNPSLSHSGLTSLSYSGYNTQAKRPSSTNTLSATRSTQNNAARPTVSPIGWNVPPKSQGPPPAYSPTNPVGGAKTNIHEPAPSYKPNNAAPPSYSQSTNRQQPTTATHYNSQHSSANYNRNRYNSTGGGSGSGVHTPITATNAHNVQSSYPRQQMPAGATYYPSASSLPAGATYHSPGSLPPGATYHSAGSLPPGATYHPGGSLPAGATHYSPGSLPPGAVYHPSGGLPAGATYHAPGALPPGATYHPAAPVPAYYPAPAAMPAAMPAGATFLPAGSSLPAGATFVSQPPKSSSGLGFGSGLLAGGLAGGLLGHALTPTHTKVVEHSPVMSGGYGGGGGGSGNNNGEDRIIIINNGPPGSVSTTNAGPGTTVINTGASQPPAAEPGPQQAAAPTITNAPPSEIPSAALAPLNPMHADTTNTASAAGTETTGNAVAGNGVISTNSAIAQSPPVGVQSPETAESPAEQPPTGGIVCVPIKVPEPDPNDSSKTIEVEKIVCYPAPPPQETSTVNEISSSTVLGATETLPSTSSLTSSSTSSSNIAELATQSATTLEHNAPLAPLKSTPFTVPEGSVALAPFHPGDPPHIMKIAAASRPMAFIAESANIMVASGSNYNLTSFGLILLSTFTTLTAYYCT